MDFAVELLPRNEGRTCRTSRFVQFVIRSGRCLFSAFAGVFAPHRRCPQPTTPALADQSKQSPKPSRPAKPMKPVPACAQPLERFAEDNPTVTRRTTTPGKVEHASRCARTRNPARAFPHELRVSRDCIATPARALMTALLFLPAAAATACPIGWTPSPTSATWGPRCYLWVWSARRRLSGVSVRLSGKNALKYSTYGTPYPLPGNCVR